MSGTQLTLNLLEGSVSFSFTPDAARELKAAFAELMASLKTLAAAKAAPGSAGKPERLKSMEYRYAGEVFLELECNPNIWPSPFAAKVLVTVRDERIRLMAEAELTRAIEDVNQYLERVG